MIEKIKCILGFHNDEYLYLLPHKREEVSQCKQCGKYFVYNRTSNYGYRTKEKPKEFIELPTTGICDLSDGYHSFNELYHHRAVLFSVICNMNPSKAWKSKQHNDGTMYDGMFIVGINTPHGQATYHYDIEPYWNYFIVQEIETAPIWDGHTPEEALSRLLSYGLLGGEQR